MKMPKAVVPVPRPVMPYTIQSASHSRRWPSRDWFRLNRRYSLRIRAARASAGQRRVNAGTKISAAPAARRARVLHNVVVEGLVGLCEAARPRSATQRAGSAARIAPISFFSRSEWWWLGS